MLRYQTIPVTPYAQNCSLIWDEASGKAACIDPGGEVERLLGAIAQRQLHLEQIWITHGHWDHAGGAVALSLASGAPIIGPQREDAFWLALLGQQASFSGLRHPQTQTFTPSRWLEDGDTLTLAGSEVLVRHCPGHTPGHVIFYVRDLQRAFVGDVLFAGSVGRTDFPRGSFEQLRQSIETKLWPLGDDVIFIPGHGEESSLGHERKHNPFVGLNAKYQPEE